MDKLLETLTSPAWWISVVVVGIVINLASSYLKSLLDKRLSKTSTWWRLRSEKQKAYIANSIDLIRHDRIEAILFGQRMTNTFLWSISQLIICIGSFTLGFFLKQEGIAIAQALISIPAAVSMILSLKFQIDYITDRKIMSAALYGPPDPEAPAPTKV